MSMRTLYVLRRRPEEIHSALFQSSDPHMDLVLIEKAGPQSISYDDLIKKIFEVERTVVI